MNVMEYTVQNLVLSSWVWLQEPEEQAPITSSTISAKPRFSPLLPLRQLLDRIEIRNPKLAHRLCKLIPANCPFERDIKVFGRTLFHIPPMCKLNPLYEEVVGLRFRALCYLADVCGEDITPYC